MTVIDRADPAGADLDALREATANEQRDRLHAPSPDAQWDDENLAPRRTFIGASEAATVIGARGAYSSITALWLKKTGQQPAERRGSQRHKEWGHRHERVILEYLAEIRPDLDIEPNLDEQAPNGDTIPADTWRHPVYKFMAATPDGLGYGDPDGLTTIDAKTADSWVADDWNDDAPDKYVAQIIWQMIVTGATVGILIVLIGGNDPRYMEYRMSDERTQAIAAALIARAQAFWQHVTDGTPPPIDVDHPDTHSDMARVWEGDENARTELSPEGRDALAHGWRCRAQVKQLTDELKAAKATVCAELAGTAVATIDGDDVATWKHPTRLNEAAMLAAHPELDKYYVRVLDTKALNNDHPGIVRKFRETNTDTRTFNFKNSYQPDGGASDEQ